VEQSKPKSEAHPSAWELESLHTFPDGTGWMRERLNTSSMSEVTRLTVRYDPGNGHVRQQSFLFTWSRTSSDTLGPPTCFELESPSGKPPTP
jgi:hypothetical protein